MDMTESKGEGRSPEESSEVVTGSFALRMTFSGFCDWILRHYVPQDDRRGLCKVTPQQVRGTAEGNVMPDSVSASPFPHKKNPELMRVGILVELEYEKSSRLDARF